MIENIFLLLTTHTILKQWLSLESLQKINSLYLIYHTDCPQILANSMACEYHKPADTMRKKEVGKITYIAKHAQRSDR